MLNHYKIKFKKFFSDSKISNRVRFLQQITLKIQDLPFCSRAKNYYTDPSSILCAGGEVGKDTCRGDSGGPLTLTDNRALKHFVVGITSRGPDFCGSPGTQGIYTNVNYYKDWILDNLQP